MRKTSLSRLSAIVLCVAVTTISTLASPQFIDLKEARQLVREALPAKTLGLPGLTLLLSEEDRANPPRCVTFDVLWSNPGRFVVNWPAKKKRCTHRKENVCDGQQSLSAYSGAG